MKDIVFPIKFPKENVELTDKKKIWLEPSTVNLCTCVYACACTFASVERHYFTCMACISSQMQSPCLQEWVSITAQMTVCGSRLSTDLV